MVKICVQSPFFREVVRAVDLIKWLYWADDPIFNGEKGGEKARSQLAHCFFCFDKILNFAIDDGCQNSFHYQLQLQLKKLGKIKYYLDLFTVLETSRQWLHNQTVLQSKLSERPPSFKDQHPW
jgi:hypothetical protein